jgi:hypothetical protein
MITLVSNLLSAQETAMNKFVLLIVFLAPVAAWSQSSDTPAAAESKPAKEIPSAQNYPSPGGKYDSTLEQVRDRLALTPEQLPLWRAYAGKVDAYTGLHYREKPAVASPEEAAPRQIGKLVDILQNRLAALEDLEGAAKTLYASLTPEQQKTANEMLLSTVPTFASSGRGADRPKEDGKSKGGRSDGGGRMRRGGGMGGGGF